MTKVVYNACYGGFGLSSAAYAEYCRRTGEAFDASKVFHSTWTPRIARHDPVLASVVESLRDAASAPLANLRISEGAGQYRIDEYDGFETVVWRDNSESEWITP